MANPQVKFGRNYLLSVEPNILGGSFSPTVIIQPPFTMELDVSRGRQGSINNCTVRVYNLAPDTRNRLLKDWNQTVLGPNSRNMRLEAGYGNNLTTIFFGTVFECHSKRSGVDFITQIEAWAGGNITSIYYSGTAFKPGTRYDVIIKALVASLAQQTGLTPGFVGSFPNTITTPYYPSSTIREEIEQLAPSCFTIDNEQINVYRSTESIPNTVTPTLIDSSMGLLETPTINQNNLTFPILFEPSITPGRFINLQSTTVETVQNPYPTLQSYNGLQLVQNVHHSGIISNVVSGKLTTNISIILGAPQGTQV